MATTLQTEGRERREIPFFYDFAHRLHFQRSDLMPEDVESWCKQNCKGYFKAISYVHEKSQWQTVEFKNDKTGKKQHKHVILERVCYVDRVYFSDEADALLIKTYFEVTDQKVKRAQALKLPRNERSVNSEVGLEALVKHLEDGSFVRFAIEGGYEQRVLDGAVLEDGRSFGAVKLDAVGRKGLKGTGNPTRAVRSGAAEVRYVADIDSVWFEERWISPRKLAKVTR